MFAFTIQMHLREQERQGESKKRFGHEHATWNEIHDHEEREGWRRFFSQSAFGHPNATWNEIQEHQKEQAQKRQPPSG